MQPVTRLAHTEVMAYRGQHILQRPPAAFVHVHIAGGDQRQSGRQRQHAQIRQPLAVIRTLVQFDRDPGASGEAGGDPVGVCKEDRGNRKAGAGLGTGGWGLGRADAIFCGIRGLRGRRCR